jgi:hypothetical protein
VVRMFPAFPDPTLSFPVATETIRSLGDSSYVELPLACDSETIVSLLFHGRVFSRARWQEVSAVKARKGSKFS